MKKLLSLLLALMLLALPAFALADDVTLTVIGTASVTLEPDMAQVSIGMETSAATVHEAVTANAEMLAKIIEALKENGVTDKDLSTANYYVNTNYDYSGLGAPAPMGYSVSNTLQVIIRDMDKIGTIIDAATAAGANQVYGVTFLSSQENDAHDRALTLAVQEGMRKATLMAMAAGRSLGSLESIEEGGQYSHAVNAVFDAKVMGTGTAIMPGDLTVTASVTITYALR